MRIRVHEGEASPSGARVLLEGLGFEIVQVRPAIRRDESDDESDPEPADIVFWDLSSDPTVSALEVRCLLRDRDLTRIPFLTVLPPDQIGLEMAVLNAGCEGVVRHPVTPDAIVRAVASLGNRYANRMPPAAGLVTVLAVGGAEAVSRLTAGAGGPHRIVLGATTSDDAVALARRIGFDVTLVSCDLDEGGLVALAPRLRAAQPDITLIAVGSEGTAAEMREVLRVGADDYVKDAHDGARLADCVEDALRERRDRKTSRELAARISAKQRELQRVNETLRTINKAITDANIRLERQTHKKDEVIGVAAHELKTPLAAVAGALDILGQDSSRFEPEDLELMHLMQRNVRRMVKLVDDILDLSRLESGRIHVNRRPVTVAALFDSAVSSVAMKARAKDIRFDMADENIDTHVEVDEERTVQMLVNLMDNALKFSPNGAIVRLHTKVGRGMIHVVVADAGPGIPEAERSEVFERFHRRARGDDPHSAGSGLGLTITRALARLQGGTVSVGESPHGGAQFTISLPIDGVAETR